MKYKISYEKMAKMMESKKDRVRTLKIGMFAGNKHVRGRITAINIDFTITITKPNGESVILDVWDVA